MRKVPNFGDDRQNGFCVHCGGRPETKDHAPSKVFLDMPHPIHMPTLQSCSDCNNGFSDDEEYLACFIECVICGTTDPEKLRRDKIRKALARNGRLRGRIKNSKREGQTYNGKSLLSWHPEENCVRSVVLKLARCHAAYELNEPQLEEPAHIGAFPLQTLSTDQLRDFETSPESGGWPEVGSRALQRVSSDGAAINVGGWLEVQEGRYRFMAVGAGNMIVQGVLSEYLGYEVIWE